LPTKINLKNKPKKKTPMEEKYKSIEVEVELSIGNATVQVDVYYYSKECKCDTHRGVESWEEIEIEHVDIVDAKVYNPDTGDFFKLNGPVMNHLTFTDVNMIESEVATYMYN